MGEAQIHDLAKVLQAEKRVKEILVAPLGFKPKYQTPEVCALFNWTMEPLWCSNRESNPDLFFRREPCSCVTPFEQTGGGTQN